LQDRDAVDVVPVELVVDVAQVHRPVLVPAGGFERHLLGHVRGLGRPGKPYSFRVSASIRPQVRALRGIPRVGRAARRGDTPRSGWPWSLRTASPTAPEEPPGAARGSSARSPACSSTRGGGRAVVVAGTA